MSDSAPPPPPPENPYGQTPQSGPAYGQNPYGAPGVPGAPGPGGPGQLLDRFVARLIDYILVGIVGAVVGVIIGVGSYMAGGGGYGASLLSGVISALISLGYFAGMESTQGRTLGKMVMKLHTVSPKGSGNPTFGEAVKRNIFTATGVFAIVPFLGTFIGGIISLVAVIVIAVQINGDPARRQAWHDKFAGGTQVLKNV